MRRRLPLALVVAALLVTGTIASAGSEHRREAVTAASASFDLRAPRQVISGFGSSERIWSDPHMANASGIVISGSAQAEILRTLYGRLGLTRVRNVLDQGVQREVGGPFIFIGKATDGHVAFVKQARPFGLRLFFPGPVYVEPWMTAEDTGAYVNWAMTVLRRWRALGLEPRYYAPLNEPKIDGDFPPKWMHDVVAQLGARLRFAGFRTKLVVPDDENPADAYRRAVAVLDDPRARQYVGALAYHIYGGNTSDMARMHALAVRYGLPLWMTEYNSSRYTDWNSSLDWATRLHTVLTVGNVNAVDYLWGFFGSHDGTAAYVSIDFGGGAYRGFSLTSVAYMTGQYSRFVRPGYVRIAGTSSVGPVLTSAYRGGGRVVVVATNPSGDDHAVRVTLRRGAVTGMLSVVRSSDSERWRALPPTTVRRSMFSASLPGHSITTFVLRAKR